MIGGPDGPPPKLKPCPFCGQPLTVRWRRIKPKAHCSTPECWGGKLPVLPLDLPEFVDAWNTRAVVDQPSGAEWLTWERLKDTLAIFVTGACNNPKRDSLTADDWADQIDQMSARQTAFNPLREIKLILDGEIE